MAPERTWHGKVKFAVQLALLQAIRRAGLDCHMLPDSSGVRISRHAMHVPDALVYSGPELPGDAMEVPYPVIVAEVASSSTRRFDHTVKLDGYFSLPSVQHYLVVDPEGPPVVHYRRQSDGTPVRSLVHKGALALSPPGLELGVADMLAAP
jgi:Uma2 family endonuclease